MIPAIVPRNIPCPARWCGGTIWAMAEANEQSGSRRSARVRGIVAEQPGWKKWAAVLAIVVALVGAAWQAKILWIDKPDRAPAAAENTGGAGGTSIPGVSSLARSGNAPAAAEAPPAEPSLGEKISPWMTKVGIAFVIGLVAGIIFRVFVKTMLVIAVLLVGGLLALSYFGILHVDLSAAQQHYNNTSDWILDQATRLKDMIMAKLPTTSTWTIGFIAGFKRK
jgi:uncharacterized membrane protein (Fun14 family)